MINACADIRNQHEIPLQETAAVVMNPRIPDSWSEEILWTTGLEWVQANKSKILRFGNRFLNFAAATNEDLLQTANILSFEVLMSLLKTGGLHLFVPVFFSRFRAHLTELSRGPRIDYQVSLDEATERYRDPDAISFLPGFSWPSNLTRPIAEQAFQHMTKRQAWDWTTYLFSYSGLSTSAAMNRARKKRSRRTFYKNLQAGIQRVLKAGGLK